MSMMRRAVSISGVNSFRNRLRGFDQQFLVAAMARQAHERFDRLAGRFVSRHMGVLEQLAAAATTDDSPTSRS